MRTLAAIFLALCFVPAALSQEKALTQAEYVKMLYAVQKDPTEKPALLDALRKRGIDFSVTDGLRSLTRSKTSNDDDVKHALEEAGLRHANPEAAKMPPPKDVADVLEKTRLNTLAALED